MLDENRACLNTAGYILNNEALKELSKEEGVVEGRKKESGQFDMAGNLIKGCVEREIPVYAIIIDNWADLGSNTKYRESVERALAGEFPFIESILESKGYINIGRDVWIHEEAYTAKYGDEKSLKELIESDAIRIGPKVLIDKGVRVKEGAEIEYSSIEKQVSIGEKSNISHSVVFPYCIIEENAIIERCILGLQAHIDSSKDNKTITKYSFLGPEVFVPKGYELRTVTVYPAYEFENTDIKRIVGKVLRPGPESLQRVFQTYMNGGPS